MGCGASTAAEGKAQQRKSSQAPAESEKVEADPAQIPQEKIVDVVAAAEVAPPSTGRASPVQAAPVVVTPVVDPSPLVALLGHHHQSSEVGDAESLQASVGADEPSTAGSAAIEAAALNASVASNDDDTLDAARRRASFIGPNRTLGRSFAVKQRAKEGIDEEDEEQEEVTAEQPKELTHHEKMIQMYLNKTPDELGGAPPVVPAAEPISAA